MLLFLCPVTLVFLHLFAYRKRLDCVFVFAAEGIEGRVSFTQCL